VDLRKYIFRAEHKDCFEWTAKKGGREETIAFEEHFRRLAPNALEAWFEVVFWKLASQPQIRNGTTQRIAESLSKHATAGELWHRCDEYVQSRSEAEARTRFEAFHKLFGLKTSSIAIVATFPAFMEPDRFPMVDKRVASWVVAVMREHNGSDPSWVQLVLPKSLNSSNKVLNLNMRDFDFMTQWVKWCQHRADRLTQLTDGFPWRARDVEMAVFRAWGEKSAKKHPELNLPPVPSR